MQGLVGYRLALKVRKQFFIIAGLILLLIVTVALISTFWPRNETQFFELGLLDKNKTATAYFAIDNSTLEIGTQVKWFVFIHNNMNSAQKVSIRVKLLNSTMAQPIDSKNTPSPFSFFLELPSQLSVNETVLLPFSWSITDVVSQDGTTIIRQLRVNEHTYDINVSSKDYFSLVFELWFFDPVTQDYAFGWHSGNEFSSASINMGFQIK
jgi:hypothetical protein